MSERSRVLVTGITGQVGRRLVEQLGQYPSQFEVTGWSRAQFDFGDLTISDSEFERRLATALDALKPQWILNPAAHTAVDLAETQVELAERLNVMLPGALARWCKKNGSKLIHFSTDYVFSGEGELPWRETDTPDPKNSYGRSKLAGECAVLKSEADAWIFRISWVYDCFGNNFFLKMLQLGAERERLTIVNDQVGSPCFARDLAKVIVGGMVRGVFCGRSEGGLVTGQGLQSRDTTGGAPGIYHLVSQGETSWFGFAERIFSEAVSQAPGYVLKAKERVPVGSDVFVTPAKRPKNSRLDCNKAKLNLKLEMPTWTESLHECILEWAKNYGNSSH
jgi:dTDP-4-dehydrorhamnose reductase